jgi:hypothetical protein
VEFPIGPSIAYVPLTRGFYALIDRDDAEIVGQWNWSVSIEGTHYYATRGVEPRGSKMRMHRLLCPAPKGMLVDHRNGNGLHNFKANLRVATYQNNNHNRGKSKTNKSGYKGVSFRKQNGKWRASIAINGKVKDLGYFSDPKEAHEAYLEASRKYHGEFFRAA